MYVTGDHAPHAHRPVDADTARSTGRRAPRAPLRLARVITDPAGATGSGGRYSPALADYLADLARLHGLRRGPDDFAGVARTTFTDLVRPLVTEVADAPVDLIVLAHVTPDAEPGWPASFLTGALPGEPLAFAVADQGVAAPFTALRVAAAYARADRFERVLVVLLDQGTFLTAGPPPQVGAGLVALVLDRGGTLGEMSTRVVAGVPPPRARSVLASSLADFAGTLVTGAALSPPDGPQGTAPGPVGLPGSGLGPVGLPETAPGPVGLPGSGLGPVELPGTGLWRELTDRLAGGGPVALADYDPAARCLGICVVAPPDAEPAS
ncbi:beta-ketoacyl-[acyl-carrier-protein] synthase family protein [Micromonospora coxensis]|uniref:Uncharacterized protein n=1 Tax=Micromonospora coxensis TaxID=356852 RepID=A0A1C5K0H5_9ACTN|nr:hypothetical protein [Micromonospora coxensis]SCG76320.1 hypothetical protein GA0070614_5893 [Micromonospora coxensis]